MKLLKSWFPTWFCEHEFEMINEHKMTVDFKITRAYQCKKCLKGKSVSIRYT